MTPSTESDRTLLTHIAESIDEIRAYTGGTTYTTGQSRETQRAVERVLQILAESTQRLTPALKATQPQVPWTQIAGLRNRLVHGYLYIDQEIVRDIVEQDLPQLEEALKRMTEQAAQTENLLGMQQIGTLSTPSDATKWAKKLDQPDNPATPAKSEGQEP